MKVGHLERVHLCLVGCGGSGSWLAPSVARIAVQLREQGVEVQVTLVDPDGDRFYVQPCTGEGFHTCDRGTGPVCEPVSATSCGDGLACTDCTALPRPTPSTAICQASGTCGYQCNEGWLRCDAGCCRALAVSAGRSHTCAIVAQPPAWSSGQLRCWGANDRGQLGVGDTQDRLVPTDVLLMNSGVTLVAAGASHTCAVKGGALYCWGANSEASQDARRAGRGRGVADRHEVRNDYR